VRFTHAYVREVQKMSSSSSFIFEPSGFDVLLLVVSSVMSFIMAYAIGANDVANGEIIYCFLKCANSQPLELPLAREPFQQDGLSS
jgi:hypothetical protein